jgi:hypothetical protein
MTLDCASDSAVSCSYQPPGIGNGFPPPVPFPLDQCNQKWVPSQCGPLSNCRPALGLRRCNSEDGGGDSLPGYWPGDYGGADDEQGLAKDFFCMANRRDLTFCRDGTSRYPGEAPLVTMCQRVKAPVPQW